MAIAWEQTSEYIHTSDWTETSGGPTDYLVARPVGADPADVTSFHPGQADWSPTNLPNVSQVLDFRIILAPFDHGQILYILQPPIEWEDYRQSALPDPKTDKDGNILYEQWPADPEKPEPLLDFPHLPDQIGSQEWWFVFEAWRRLEPRARWKDFMMRIHGPSRPSSHNNIQMHISRNRSKWGMLSWFTITLHENENRAREEALKMLSTEQINNNTTRGITPGLKNPALGEAGGRVPLPENLGGSIRRGRRAPGKGRGGGNNQPKFKDKPASQKNRVESEKTMIKPRQPARVQRNASAKYKDESGSQHEHPYRYAIQTPIGDIGNGVFNEDPLTTLRPDGTRYGHPNGSRLASKHTIGANPGYHNNGICSDPVEYFSRNDFADDSGIKEPSPLLHGKDFSHYRKAYHAVVTNYSPNPLLPHSVQTGYSSPSKRKVGETFGNLHDTEQWRPLKVARSDGASLGRNSHLLSYKGDIQSIGHQPRNKSLSNRGFQGSEPLGDNSKLTSPPQLGASLVTPKAQAIDGREFEKRLQKAKRRLMDEGEDEERLSKVARMGQAFPARENRLARPRKTSSSQHVNTKRSDRSGIPQIYDATPTPSAHRSKRPKGASSEAVIHRRDPRLDISYCLENSTPTNQHGNYNASHTASMMRGSDYKSSPRLGSHYTFNGYSSFQDKLPQNEVKHIQELYPAMPQQRTWREQSLTGDVLSTGLQDSRPYPEQTVIPSKEDRLWTTHLRMSNLEHGPIKSPAPVDAPQLRMKEVSIPTGQAQSPAYGPADTAKAYGNLDACRSFTPHVDQVPSSKGGLVDRNMYSQEFTYIPLDELNQLAGYTPDNSFALEPSLFHEAFIHELIQPTLHNTDDVELHHPPTHIGESNHDASDLLPWHDGSPGELNPFVLAPEDTAPTGVHFSDSTATTFPPLDWNDFVLDF
ncbi:MAG: hypothetical protein Q9225_002470 [Loekoesia sp. 1 TL-2023]